MTYGFTLGSVSGKELLKQSGIVSLLKPGMAIMVNKGFLVYDCVPCKVDRPAYLSKREQMLAVEMCWFIISSCAYTTKITPVQSLDQHLT
ncbi:hypothetical protein PHYPO_G00221760 [Pangasianodon hypophthalmus]|uniref:DDE Tnp4 domain-containing protein n=1 Tax=Pangasianodon hypophthalmus TaxID=310915 RepID=A0A5N5NUU6_PANHP|nr:hypothetical protein PHYPO_G00221760 [Pangasianodon hypophthalmus]